MVVLCMYRNMQDVTRPRKNDRLSVVISIAVSRFLMFCSHGRSTSAARFIGNFNALPVIVFAVVGASYNIAVPIIKVNLRSVFEN